MATGLCSKCVTVTEMSSEGTWPLGGGDGGGGGGQDRQVAADCSETIHFEAKYATIVKAYILKLRGPGGAPRWRAPGHRAVLKVCNCAAD